MYIHVFSVGGALSNILLVARLARAALRCVTHRVHLRRDQRQRSPQPVRACVDSPVLLGTDRAGGEVGVSPVQVTDPARFSRVRVVVTRGQQRGPADAASETSVLLRDDPSARREVARDGGCLCTGCEARRHAEQERSTHLSARQHETHQDRNQREKVQSR